MIRRLFRKSLLYGAEALVAVVLVIGFFLVSMTVLGLTFPRGTGLRDLMGGGSWRDRTRTVLRLRMDGRGGNEAVEPSVIARLADVRRRVKDKGADTVAWDDSAAGELLEERHAVQTFSLSSATISFEQRGEVTLGENSLLVLGGQEVKDERTRKDVSLFVTSGGLRGTLQGGQQSGRDFHVVTASGEALITGAAPKTDFHVSVNPDRSSTFAVYRGSSEIVAAGRSVTLRPNQAVTVMPGEPPGKPFNLPEAPALGAPAENASIPYRLVPPNVELSWKTVPGATGYRVELARDRAFKNLVDAGPVEEARFAHGNLGRGAYYWRVRALRGSAESEPSPPRRFAVVPDREPPALRVSFPVDEGEGGGIVVAGETEPGAEVFIGREKVEPDARGRFEHALKLVPGWNVVVVEAVDAAGNTAYETQRLMQGHSQGSRSQ